MEESHAKLRDRPCLEDRLSVARGLYLQGSACCSEARVLFKCFPFGECGNPATLVVWRFQGLDMDRDLGKEIDDMCNFSDLIEERAIEQGIEQGRRLELDYGIRTAIKAYSMLGSSYEKARAFIMKEYNLSPSDAESKMQEYWEN